MSENNYSGDGHSSHEPDILQINCYHGGKFVFEDENIRYENGSVTHFKNFDPDYLSWFQFEKAIERLRYGSGIHRLWYKLSFESLDDRKPLFEDPDRNIRETCEAAKWLKEVDVYVEHKVTEPLLVEIPSLLEYNIVREENVEEADREEQPNANIGRDDREEDDVDGFDNEEPTINMETNVDIEEERDDEPNVVEQSDGSEKMASDIEENELDKEYPDTPTATDEEWDQFDKKKKFQYKPPSGGFRNVYLSLMMEFDTAEDFKEAVFKYGLMTGYDVKLNRSSSMKCSAICNYKGCSWRVYCSLNKHRSRWMIKTFNDHHSCVKSGRTKVLKIPQIARMFQERLRKKPEFTAAEMKDEVKREFNLIVTKNQCSKAKAEALDIIRGDFKNQFSKLWDYELELHRSNPGITTELQTKPGGQDGLEMFHRFYVCFDALKTAWKQCCRPVIGLDRCFLKWAIQGEILAAIGRDPNNKIYPIAWAVVSVENTDNWEWFVRKLKSDLQLGTGKDLMIITDKQKGLLKVIEQEFPKVEHRMCARYIYANWRKQHKESMLKPLFWQVAKSYNEATYEENLEVIRQLNVDAYASLLATNPRTWCRAFFRTDSHCDDVHNNLSEAFNSTIKKARSKPLLQMLDDIRRQAMQRIARRSIMADKWIGTLTPKAQNDLEIAREKAKDCVMYRSTQGLYEVDDRGTGYTVSLSAKSCACREWDLTGIPCRHAICVLNECWLEVSRYVSEFYLASRWQDTYRYSIKPVNGERLWRKSGKPQIAAPDIRSMPGRPKKSNRIKDPHESPTKPGRVSGHGRRMTCRHCWETGHNAKSCPKKSKAPSPKPPESSKRPRGRPRKHLIGESSGSNASNTSSRSKRGRPPTSSRQIGNSSTSGAKRSKKNSRSSQDAEGTVSSQQVDSEALIQTQPTQGSQTQNPTSESRQQRSTQRTLGIRRRERVPQGYGLYISPMINRMFFRTGPRRITEVTPNPPTQQEQGSQPSQVD